MNEKLPEGWVWTTLGELGEWHGGGTPSKASAAFWTGGSIPWVSPKDMKMLQIHDTIDHLSDAALEESSLKLCPAGTVLIVVRSGILVRTLPVGIAQVPIAMNQDMKGIFPYCGVNSSYIVYYLIFTEKNILATCSKTGTTVASINSENLQIYEVPLAPLAEQARIVAAIEQQFTRIDSAVASLKSAQAKTKQYRASLLKSAVEGELTKAWRAANPASETGEQLLARILAERRKRWEEEQLEKMREKGKEPWNDEWKKAYKEPQGPDVEDLPELPEGWCWASLEQCSRRVTDGTHQPPQFAEVGIPFIFVKHIVKGQISFKDTKYISDTTYRQLNARCPVETGDILYSAVGSYGIAVPVLTSHPFSFQRHIAHIKPSLLLNLHYLVACLNSSLGLKQAHKVARGVAQKTVTLTDLIRFTIPLPPLAEQARIVAEVEARLSEIEKMEETIEHSLKRAEQERQSILREAFAGRLVAQDPEDEPASVLLARIREERANRSLAEQGEKSRRRTVAMEIAGRRRGNSNRQRRVGLHNRLIEAGQPLPPGDLFKRVGLKADEQPSTEVFYDELQGDVEDKLIRELRPDYEQVLLEALEPSEEMLAEALEQLAKQEPGQKLERPTLWEMEH